MDDDRQSETAYYPYKQCEAGWVQEQIDEWEAEGYTPRIVPVPTGIFVTYTKQNPDG